MVLPLFFSTIIITVINKNDTTIIISIIATIISLLYEKYSFHSNNVQEYFYRSNKLN